MVKNFIHKMRLYKFIKIILKNLEIMGQSFINSNKLKSPIASKHSQQAKEKSRNIQITTILNRCLKDMKR